MKKEHTVNLSCSFCGKSQREVRKLISGPRVYICDACIGLCNDIIAEQAEREAESEGEVRTVFAVRLRRHEAVLTALVGFVRRHGDLLSASMKDAIDDLDLASTRLRQVVSESMALEKRKTPSG
jgi:hypothetical protein